MSNKMDIPFAPRRQSAAIRAALPPSKTLVDVFTSLTPDQASKARLRAYKSKAWTMQGYKYPNQATLTISDIRGRTETQSIGRLPYDVVRYRMKKAEERSSITTAIYITIPSKHT